MRNKAKRKGSGNCEQQNVETNESEDDLGVEESEEEVSDNEHNYDEDDEIDEDEDINEAGYEIVPVNEDASLFLSTEFRQLVNRDDEAESDDSEDEVLKDDKIPEDWSCSEDEEEEHLRRLEEPEDSRSEDIVLGKIFGSAAEFKLALLRYSLKSGYDIKLYMSTQKRLGVICSDVDCSWRVYCSYEKSKHKLQIKVYESRHSCTKSGYSKMLKISTIAQLYADRLRLDPKFTAVAMTAEILRNYNLRVSIEQCRKAKTKIMKEMRKCHEAHFARIWDYEAELHRTNEGTIVDIETTPGATQGSLQRFHRIYICFKAQRNAWKSYCRPIIGLDSAFLKWDVKGQLLAAIGRDGDNRIVPIAWAVVEIENNANWEWFVNHLKVDLGLGDGKEYTIISDKQKGLVNAVHTMLPEAEHRMCARHILGNWKRDSHDMQMERLF